MHSDTLNLADLFNGDDVEKWFKNVRSNSKSKLMPAYLDILQKTFNDPKFLLQ